MLAPSAGTILSLKISQTLIKPPVSRERSNFNVSNVPTVNKSLRRLRWGMMCVSGGAQIWVYFASLFSRWAQHFLEEVICLVLMWCNSRALVIETRTRPVSCDRCGADISWGRAHTGRKLSPPAPSRRTGRPVGGLEKEVWGGCWESPLSPLPGKYGRERWPPWTLEDTKGRRNSA